ncbi:hypothetical protein COCON_G00197830 [Conger conger]|uniref:Uncharacterized protein n=1 Tax=Conger conger TaxID=82655 RepID=A0A9Q1HQY9_CONCO|nr:hypothetical protein COCON_G00197830 [Conger conger]
MAGSHVDKLGVMNNGEDEAKCLAAKGPGTVEAPNMEIGPGSFTVDSKEFNGPDLKDEAQSGDLLTTALTQPPTAQQTLQKAEEPTKTPHQDRSSASGKKKKKKKKKGKKGGVQESSSKTSEKAEDGDGEIQENSISAVGELVEQAEVSSEEHLASEKGEKSEPSAVPETLNDDSTTKKENENLPCEGQQANIEETQILATADEVKALEGCPKSPAGAGNANKFEKEDSQLSESASLEETQARNDPEEDKEEQSPQTQEAESVNTGDPKLDNPGDLKAESVLDQEVKGTEREGPESIKTQEEDAKQDGSVEQGEEPTEEGPDIKEEGNYPVEEHSEVVEGLGTSSRETNCQAFGRESGESAEQYLVDGIADQGLYKKEQQDTVVEQEEKADEAEPLPQEEVDRHEEEDENEEGESFDFEEADLSSVEGTLEEEVAGPTSIEGEEEQEDGSKVETQTGTNQDKNQENVEPHLTKQEDPGCEREEEGMAREQLETAQVDKVQNPGDDVFEERKEIRLRKLVDEREALVEQVKKLKAQLEQSNGTQEAASPEGDVLENGTDSHILDVQRDANRHISDLKFKLVKSEQEVTALEQNVIRLEGQVTRYKTASENAEKVEDDLKAEKRRMQRELRSALDKIDELEASNSHLGKRLEKMKANRSALLSQQ